MLNFSVYLTRRSFAVEDVKQLAVYNELIQEFPMERGISAAAEE